MAKEVAIIKQENEVRAIAPLDPQTLITQAIDKGVSVDILERLVALAKDMRAVQAKEAYDSAMAEFQRTCPPIKKTGSANIQTKGGGSYGYSYAPLDEITRVISPVLGGLGFSISYKMKHGSKEVSANCILTHSMGHSEDSGEVTIPVTSGDWGANEAQRVGISSSYAKRYALLAITGISPEDDPDAQGGKGKPAPAKATYKKAEAVEAVEIPKEVLATCKAFANIGVSHEYLEQFTRTKREYWTPEIIADLNKQGKILSDAGDAGVAEFLAQFSDVIPVKKKATASAGGNRGHGNDNLDQVKKKETLEFD